MSAVNADTDVSKTKTVIQINGKRYDADTGESLERVRQVAAHAAGHRPKHAKTLMRHAVKKPSAKVRVRTVSPVVESQIVVGPIDNPVDPKRLQRAKHVNQSNSISHFSAIEPTIPEIAPVPSPAPTPAAHHQPKTTAEVLEHALHTATSHQQKAPKHKRGKRLHVAVAALVLLAIISVVGSQDLTNARWHQAAATAGFAAALPSNRPAGYSLDQLSASTGQVTTQFQSHSDTTSHYTLTQKPSNWDDATLLSRFVVPTDAHYQTTQTNGQTVYLYGNQNATWLHNGIWYIVASNGTLSDRQLTNLATSL